MSNPRGGPKTKLVPVNVGDNSQSKTKDALEENQNRTGNVLSHIHVTKPPLPDYGAGPPSVAEDDSSTIFGMAAVVAMLMFFV